MVIKNIAGDGGQKQSVDSWRNSYMYNYLILMSSKNIIDEISIKSILFKEDSDWIV